MILLIIGASAGLYGYNLYLDKNISREKNTIAAVEKQVSDISKDRSIIIAKILSSNTIRPSIDLK